MIPMDFLVLLQKKSQVSMDGAGGGGTLLSGVKVAVTSEGDMVLVGRTVGVGGFMVSVGRIFVADVFTWTISSVGSTGGALSRDGFQFEIPIVTPTNAAEYPAAIKPSSRILFNPSTVEMIAKKKRDTANVIKAICTLPT